MTPDEALRHIQAQHRYLFERAEFAALLGKAPGDLAVTGALSRLSRKKRIVAAAKRTSAWVIVPPEYEHYGAPPVTWWLNDYMKQLEPCYYVGLLSAARYWGSAHYAVQTTQVMVSRARRSVAVGAHRLDFTVKARLKETPTVMVRGDVAPWRVSTREATLLDLLRAQVCIGGIEAVARVSNDLAKKLEADEMTRALDGLDHTSTAQRLGFLLEALGHVRPARRVRSWIASRRTASIPLELQAPDDCFLELNKDWGVLYAPGRLSFLAEIQ
jgi:predicted transcriptional regulator of viral defense system